MIFAVVIAVFVLANAAPRGDDGSVDGNDNTTYFFNV